MTPDHQKYVLCIDDTGSRELNRNPLQARRDGMDWFGLGGVLVKGEDVAGILVDHQAFCAEQGVDYPLHSAEIRGGRGRFGWLKSPERAGYFMPALQRFVLAQPFLATAVVVHRPGYFGRYHAQHRDDLWDMDKTAFSILVERSAKFADHHGRRLEVFFERSGKHEDRALKRYARQLKVSGPPFDTGRSSSYAPLSPEDFRRIILGEPRERTKKFALTQLADLVLYPIAKAGYDPDYRPYRDLEAAGRLIEAGLPEALHASCGIKYSCFGIPDRPKAQDES